MWLIYQFCLLQITDTHCNHTITKMNNKKALVWLSVAFASFTAMMPVRVIAAQIEEIIVTALKRPEAAQQVGLAVSALGEADYREITSGLLGELASQMTNVEAYVTNSFLQSVHIRGIGLNEFQGQYDSPVAQHFDEVYISKPWMVARPRHDIERVEVLKGPQGTLFGRNTTGGAVNFYRAAPTSERFTRFELSHDEHERSSIQGVFNGALSEDLSGRVSVRRDLGSGGPQKNLFTGNDHGEPDSFDGRLQFLWDRGDLSVRTLLHGGYDKSEKVAWKGPGVFNIDSPGYCQELISGEVSMHPSLCAKFNGFASMAGFPEGEFEPEEIFTINQNTPPIVDDSFHGGYVRIEYDAEWATFFSITAYEYYERIHEEDSPGDIFDATSSHYYNEMNQFSQEFRLVGELGRRVQYLMGLFYETDDLAQVDGSDLSAQPLPGVTPPFADQFFAQFDLEVESRAAFGHVEFDLTDNIDLIFWWEIYRRSNFC